MRACIRTLSLLAAFAILSALPPDTATAQVFITQWGGLGSGDGQFNEPLGIATDAAGDVYVVDATNYRVQKFTSSGAYLTQWPLSTTPSTPIPIGIATDAAGDADSAAAGGATLGVGAAAAAAGAGALDSGVAFTTRGLRARFSAGAPASPASGVLSDKVAIPRYGCERLRMRAGWVGEWALV